MRLRVRVSTGFQKSVYKETCINMIVENTSNRALFLKVDVADFRPLRAGERIYLIGQPRIVVHDCPIPGLQSFGLVVEPGEEGDE